MFIGHYSISFVTKRMENQIPLWLLFLAVQFLDIIWSILVFFNIEKASITHSIPGMPLNLYYMPFTHSLVGAIFWSVFAFLGTRFIPILKDTNTKKALLIAFAVFSHWLLDLVVHKNDLPLWADKYKVGFGLYGNALLSFLLEVLLLGVALIIYLRSSDGIGFRRINGLIIFTVFMVLLDVNSVWGISPPNSKVAAGFLFICYFLFAFVISRIEHNRKNINKITKQLEDVGKLA